MDESKIMMLSLSNTVFILQCCVFYVKKERYLKETKIDFNGTSKKQPVHEHKHYLKWTYSKHQNYIYNTLQGVPINTIYPIFLFRVQIMSH